MPNHKPAGKLLFTFPGQGSFNTEVLRELYESFSYEAEFQRANRLAESILGHGFLPLVSSDADARNNALKSCPELDQLAIYVTNYLVASELMASGIRPDTVLGHSFGEIAALAIAGVYSFETGLRIVCQRSAVVSQVRSGGKMAALSCNAERAAEMIRKLGKASLEVAVLNHRRQTVISGLAVDVDHLGEEAARHGIGMTVLKSRHPFHSSLLQPAIAPFRLILGSYAFATPAIPVYLCTEQKMYSGEIDLSVALSEQFVKPLDFIAILRDLHQAGFRRFVECGAGNIVTRVTLESGLEGIEAWPACPVADGARNGCAAILRELGASSPTARTSHTTDLAELVKDMRVVLERASIALSEVAAPANMDRLPAIPLKAVVVEETLAETEPCDADPVAIVSIGCVLPGAHNPEQYWNNILNGVSGITDLGRNDATAAVDFLGGSAGHDSKIASDKTYTLLSGTAGLIVYDAALLSASYSEAQFAKLTRAEKLLAMASAQALGGGFRAALSGVPADRVECVLGATADGSHDYDYSEFEASMVETLQQVETDKDLRKAFSASLRRIWGEPPQDRSRLSQSESCRAVIETSAGRPIRTYIIDAACSSSLYAIGLGVTALQDHTKDVMLVGGVFAPALANSALFAQFRGLSPTGSRPLDVSADGVIFGEGSGLLVLKRLSDAMAAGDRIFGVVRGVGVSSDGKSPAINVPQSKGQGIAIRRAYQASHIDPDSIQYVEAHATATPVGDAVEFGALRQSITRDPALPRIELGSVKALIGHTGWAAGAASVIKLCKAFENATVPPQYNYNSPNQEIDLNASPFRISTSAGPWLPNIRSLPRRAAINGFGFGGTNAHLILEEFHPAFHKKLCAGVKPSFPEFTTLAVIDAAALFPTENGFESPAPAAQRAFPRPALRLPKGKRLLPDVTEHMDPGQYLALLAAERVLPALGDRLKELRDEIGVVIGVESKTERGIQANQRIFLDRLKRLFAADHQPDGLVPAKRAEILERLCATVRKDIIPSGPYTLPGLMPNVISGRVANMFELNGPNVVIDMDVNSLFQSVLVARDFLTHGECKAVLAGGLNASRMAPAEAEAAFLMLLTTEATARELKLPVACLLTIGNSRSETAIPPSDAVSYRGAQGAVELSAAIAKIRQGSQEVVVQEPHKDSGVTKEFIFRPVHAAVASKPEIVAKVVAKTDTAAVSSTYAYVQNTPIYYYTPVEVAAALPTATETRRGRRILFVTDQPGHWKQLEKNGALSAFDYHVLCAQPGSSLSNSTEIDVASEDNVKKVLAGLAVGFDTVVPVKFAGDGLPDGLIATESGNSLALVEAVFAVGRHYYEGFQSGAMSIGTLCLGAYVDGKLNPFTGLLAGFVKSFARELPAAICRSLNVAQTDFRAGMILLDSELSHKDQAVEVCYHDGNRFVIELSKIERPSIGETPVLTADSVVLATGAGRGVTAVLAEEILTKFGCTVVAIGRTNPASIPAEMRSMDAAQLALYEPEFYKSEMAKGTGQKIMQLRDKFRTYQAAQEVGEVVRSLSALPGRFEYISADITDQAGTTAIVEATFRKYGRLDMVLHGAGIQISKVVTKKTVADFRSVLNAKIASLRHIYQACERLRASRPVHYHLLTSAFSYMGNDGQPDYGAVNESINRLADVMNASRSGQQAGAGWCSVAWLGWAGIGMTRGSEFAALAANRGLRGITKSEGQEIFSNFLIGTATAPINILMADGEFDYYKVKTTPNSYAAPLPRPVASSSQRSSLTIERVVTAEGAPYILNHCVDGIPTLPGAFLIMMVAEAALELRPNLKITAFEDASFRKFVRLRSDGPTKLRLNVSLVTEDQRSTLINVQVVSDFTHKSGKILQKDVVQTEISVRMNASVGRAQTANGVSRQKGRMLSDPYVMKGSPVHLNGPFRTLSNIVVSDNSRTADYQMTEKIQGSAGGRAFLSSLMVMDSLWRFGAIDMDADNSLPVYVPEACKVMKVFYDLSSPGDAPTLSDSLAMTGMNPTADQDKLTIGPIEVVDSAGSVLLTVDGGVCRRLGEVRNGH
jgi:acyl transferase domain-containing protein/NAD(P)-dependent dehydrogenase (short-subunit alcohol dehydrogenase family)